MEISKSVSGQHSSAILPGVILIMSVDMTQRGAVRDHQQVRMVKVRRGFGDLLKLDRPLQQLEAFTALKALQRGKGICRCPRDYRGCMMGNSNQPSIHGREGAVPFSAAQPAI